MTLETHVVILPQVLTPCSNHHTELWGVHTAVYGCADGLSRFWSFSHSHDVFLLLSLGLCCFMQHSWVSSAWQIAAMVYLCKQEQSQGTRLAVFIDTSLGNTPCHSRWKYKLKREFILGNHSLLPPEGLWLVRPLEGHKKSTCYSSCTSLNKLQEDVRKGRVSMGKERRGKLDEAEEMNKQHSTGRNVGCCTRNLEVSL